MFDRNRPLESLTELLLIRLAGVSTILILVLIVFFMLKEGLPFLFHYNFVDFFTGKQWIPLSDKFGSLPLTFGSLLVTVISTFIAVPLALAVALFTSEIAPPALRTTMKVSLEILASVPSVVFGFIGIVFLAPLLEQTLHIQTGLNAFTAGLLLAFMSIPTIASVAEEALQAVPRNLREASLALGATRLQTMLYITFPAASSGIVAGTMLGIGRAIGETMTVMMVAGGSAQITLSIFSPTRTMTGTIAAEMGEVIHGDLHYQSLFMLGLLLFLITLAINSLSSLIISRIKKNRGN